MTLKKFRLTIRCTVLPPACGSCRIRKDTSWCLVVSWDEIRVFYDVTKETVEILAIVPKAEAAAWLERYGEQAEEQSEPDKENNS